jgi:hypothetical protein
MAVAAPQGHNGILGVAVAANSANRAFHFCTEVHFCCPAGTCRLTLRAGKVDPRCGSKPKGEQTLFRLGHPPLAFKVDPIVIVMLLATESQAPRIGREENKVETSKR